MKRDVTARIVLNVGETADLVFAIAVSSAYTPTSETISAQFDGHPVEIAELHDAHDGRLHRLTAAAGELVVSYAASVTGLGEPLGADETELLVYRRPSRYAERTCSRRPQRLSSTAWRTTATCSMPCRRGSARGSATSRDRHCPPMARCARCSTARAYAVTTRTCASRCCVPEASRRGWPPCMRRGSRRDAADTAFLNVLSGRASLVEATVTAVVDDLSGDDLDQLERIR